MRIIIIVFIFWFSTACNAANNNYCHPKITANSVVYHYSSANKSLAARSLESMRNNNTAQLNIMTNLGQIVTTVPLKGTLSNTVTLNLENYTQGVYYIQLISNGLNVDNKKLVVIK